MKTGRSAALIELCDEGTLNRFVVLGSVKALPTHIQTEIILECTSKDPGPSIASRLGIGWHTVSRWRV